VRRTIRGSTIHGSVASQPEKFPRLSTAPTKAGHGAATDWL
jgi:hypothetical protein